MRLLNLDAALAWAELAAVIAARDPQGPVIPRCDRAQDLDAPLIPLSEFSPEEWSRAERPATGWLRLFAGFAVLVWVTVLVGIFVVHRGVSGAVNVPVIGDLTTNAGLLAALPAPGVSSSDDIAALLAELADARPEVSCAPQPEPSEF